MAFNSLGFLVFFAAVCAALSLTNIPAVKRALGDKLFGARHVLLIAANYAFYASWNWKCCFLLLALTVIAYVSAANCRRSRFALHAGVVHVVAADGVAAAETFKAGELLLRLAQRGFGAFHFGLRQAQGGARLGVVQLKQHVAFFHVLPVAEVDFGDRALRACA